MSASPRLASAADLPEATKIAFRPLLIRGELHFDSDAWPLPGFFLRVNPEQGTCAFRFGVPGLVGQDSSEEWMPGSRINLRLDTECEFRRAGFPLTLSTEQVVLPDGSHYSLLILSSPSFGSLFIRVPRDLPRTGETHGWTWMSLNDGQDWEDVAQVVLAEEGDGLGPWLIALVVSMAAIAGLIFFLR